MAILDPNIELPAGAFQPDPWEDAYGITLPLNHVISRDKEGKPLSYVGDFVWNWTSYDPRGQRALMYFDYWATKGRKTVEESEITPEREARIRELQYLMVCLIYRCEGKPIGFRQVRRYLEILYLFARFAESHACSVREVLQIQDRFDAFIAVIPDYRCSSVKAWIIFLCTLDPVSELGFQIAKSRRWRELKDRKEKSLNNQRQYAPLPTRIYSELINALSCELNIIEAHKNSLLGALRAAIIEHVRFKERNPNKNPDIGPGIIGRYCLEDVLSQLDCGSDLKGLGSLVSEIFHICKLQIHLFSGMRREEAEHLPFHCMETVKKMHGRKHCLIAGVTTKLEGSRRRKAKWVTTEEDGFRAIRLAQQFATVIYESLGVTPSSTESSKDDYPLFPSTEYLPWGRAETRFKNTDRVNSAKQRVSKALWERICPIIEEADIAELEDIDSFRAWRDEAEFAVGQKWPLTTHQLRRSLALYANASGLVRLSSLRRQLQHITREMSAYYGRGSAFARNFLAEDPTGYKEHIIVDWQDGEQEAQYLAFVNDVLNSDEPLHGTAGTYYKQQKMRGEIITPQELKNQIRMGRMAYHSGPLGGCTNPGPCNSVKGLRLIDITCAAEGCKYLVGKHSKIIKIIRFQRAAMNHLDPNSITYQIEKEDLDVLEKTEALWRPQDNTVALLQGAEHD